MRKKRGFSLIEVIIATFIAVILISGLFLSYRASWDMINESADIAVARTAIISKLEELKQYTYSQLLTYNNTTFTTTLANGEIMTGTITVSTDAPAKITIIMRWGSPTPKTISGGAILFKPRYETE
ncbi:MAG: PilW family protein [Planctomycetota bacterium]